MGIGATKCEVRQGEMHEGTEDPSTHQADAQQNRAAQAGAEQYVTLPEYEELLLSRKKLYRTRSFDCAHRGVLDPETGIRFFPKVVASDA